MHPIERLRMVARTAGEGPTLVAREAAAALAPFADQPAALVTACRRLIDRQPTLGPVWWLAARVLGATDPSAAAWGAADALREDPTADVVAAHLPDDAVVTVLGYPEDAGEALGRRGDLAVYVVDALGEGTPLARHLRRGGGDATLVPESGLGAAVARSTVVLLEAVAASPPPVAPSPKAPARATEAPPGFLAVSGSRAAAALARAEGIPVWLVAATGRVLPGPLWQALAARLDDDAALTAPEELVPWSAVEVVAGAQGVQAVADVRPDDCPVVPELVRW